MPAGADPQTTAELLAASLADANPQAGFLVRRFEHFAETTPDAPAIRFAAESLTYGQLNAAANVLAHELIREGARQGGVVAICLEPSPAMLVAILAVMKSGAAYVPLPPAYPAERLQQIVDQAQPLLLLGDAVTLAEGWAAGLRSLRIDASAAEPVGAADNPAVELSADDLCYLMFTSGSTGAPNGVMVSHGNLTGLYVNLQDQLTFSRNDRWSFMHSFAFGFSVWEIWGALSNGAELIVVPEAMRGDPQAWSGLLLDSSASVISVTPSAFRQWLLTEQLPTIEQLNSVRMIVFSGEAVRPDDLAVWFARYGSAGPMLVNTYALTETAGRVALKIYGQADVAQPDSEPGNMGKPTDDAELFVLDPRTGAALPPGEPGELVVSGPMLAKGYLQDPQLTAQRFVQLDFGDGLQRRCYRTGDRVAWSNDGCLVFHGRSDEQIKLRGYRIELSDIEQALRAAPDVADAAVVVTQEGAAEQLVAWVVPGKQANDAVEFWPSLGEYQVYDELLYDFMSADEIRVASYNRAFLRHVPGKVVLDIGTGKDAVLARMCAAAGARKVYAVEVLDDACASARQLVAELGLENCIEVIQGDMQSIDLPEDIDVCTQGIVGNIGSSDGIAGIWNAASRLFAKDHRAIPAVCETLIAPAQLPAAARENPGFGVLAEQYAQKIFAQAGGQFDVRLCVRNFPLSGLLAEPALFEQLDFSQELPTGYSGKTDFVVTQSGLFDGFLLWTRLHVDALEEVDFLEHQQAWLPVWFPVADVPVDVEAGDVLQARWICATPAGQVFPDYSIELDILRDGKTVRPALDYSSRHFEDRRGQTELHRRIFAAGPATDLELAALQNWLTTKLPPQMMPSRINLIDKLPLNANGKLDRQALAAVAAPAGADNKSALQSITYADPLERDIAAIWCEVLGITELSPDEDFFAAGGDSILAVRLTTEVQRYLDDTVFLAALFDAPNVVSYAGWLRAHHAEAVARKLQGVEVGGSEPQIVPVATERAPLSWPQQSLWFLQRLYPGSTGANEQFVIRVSAGADPQKLVRAWRALLADNDILRTCFTEEAGEAWPEVAESEACYLSDPTTPEDFSQLASGAAEQLALLARRDIATPFDMSKAPLLRTRLCHMPDGEYALLVTAHHIIADGLCVPLIRDALAERYGERSVEKPELQYADFAVWQRAQFGPDRLAQETGWWQEQLAGHAGQPLLTARTAPAAGAPLDAAEARLPFTLDALLADRLRGLAEASNVTLFMLLLCAWRVWLQRCFGEQDVLIGSPVTLRRDESVASMLGCMVNNVVFRNVLADGQSFAAALQAEREQALATYDHCEVPFDKVVEAVQPERCFGRHPLFQLMFMFEDRTAPDAVAGGVRFATDVLPVDRASYWDLELAITDCGAGKPLTAFFGAREDILDPAVVSWWGESFVALLAGIVGQPHAAINELPLLGNVQAQRVLHDWNQAEPSFEPDATLYQCVAHQADLTPDASAVNDTKEQLSYRQLLSRADNYAAGLDAQGVDKGTCVGLCVERSADTVALLLAVLQRGAHWLPLDPGYPEARLRQMVEQVQPALVVAGPSHDWPAPVKVFSTDQLRRAATTGTAASDATVDPFDPAYILFTSGSTGEPKGAVSVHAGAVSRCRWMWQRYGFSTKDIFAQRTSLNFVDSIWEIFGPLMHGGQLAVLPAHIERDPVAMVNWLAEQRITHLAAVPALLDALLDVDVAEPVDLRSVICSGEALSPSLAERAYSRWPLQSLFNTYGTSETWDATCYEVPRDLGATSRVPIGKPIANAAVYVLDAARQPLPPGAIGELYVGGMAVAHGYVGKPELTQERFLPDTIQGVEGGRLYRTGDLARWHADGNVELLGRMDRQFKLRGQRIEPGDIEAAACQFPGVQSAAVVLHTGGAKQSADSWLTLYIVPAESPSVSLHKEALREHLRHCLPSAHVPADIVQLEQLPLTPSGKLDVRALPANAGKPIPESTYVAPRNATEQRLAEIWAAALDVEQVGVYDDFFALRGHSLLATRVIAAICDDFGVELPLQALFEMPTVAGLARSLQALTWAQQPDGADDDPSADRERLRI